MALRIMWVSGSARRSITVLSTSVCFALGHQAHRLAGHAPRPRAPAAACAGTPISPAGRGSPSRCPGSRASAAPARRGRSPRPMRAASPASSTRCVSMAWLMTSSPTRLISRSTRSRSTRIVACDLPRFRLVRRPESLGACAALPRLGGERLVGRCLNVGLGGSCGCRQAPLRRRLASFR